MKKIMLCFLFLFIAGSVLAVGSTTTIVHHQTDAWQDMDGPEDDWLITSPDFSDWTAEYASVRLVDGNSEDLELEGFGFEFTDSVRPLRARVEIYGNLSNVSSNEGELHVRVLNDGVVLDEEVYALDDELVTYLEGGEGRIPAFGTENGYFDPGLNVESVNDLSVELQVVNAPIGLEFEAKTVLLRVQVWDPEIESSIIGEEFPDGSATYGYNVTLVAHEPLSEEEDVFVERYCSVALLVPDGEDFIVEEALEDEECSDVYETTFSVNPPSGESVIIAAMVQSTQEYDGNEWIVTQENEIVSTIGLGLEAVIPDPIPLGSPGIFENLWGALWDFLTGLFS